MRNSCSSVLVPLHGHATIRSHVTHKGREDDMSGQQKSSRQSVIAIAATVVLGVAQAAGHPWDATALAPAQRAEALLAAMTLAEKLDMLHGGASCRYVGCVNGNTRLGIPPLHLQDGPAGVGDGLGGVTLLPAPVAGAATWDTELMRRYGEVLGAEHWAKGVNVVLAPTVNIVRDPRWGRAFESFGEDPYLAGRIGAADILGIQSQGPMAQVKHYAAYNQETHRFSTADNVVVSDRALREIYLPAFERAVKEAQVASVMCSYNLVNGSQACENGRLQNGVLKGESAGGMGFTGFITADWGATHSTVGSANGGLDIEMPDARYFGSALAAAVDDGQVSRATIDDKLHRILGAMFRQGLFDRPPGGDIDTIATTPAHVAVARQVAIQGSVLLKNSDAILPLDAATRSIAVIGTGGDAAVLAQGDGSAGVRTEAVVSPYAGIRLRAGSGTSVTYAAGTARADGALPGIDSRYLTPGTGVDNEGTHGATVDFYKGIHLADPSIGQRIDTGIDFDWHGGSPVAGVPGGSWSARWTATLTPPLTGTYTFSLTSDDGSRLFIDGKRVVDGWVPQASTTRTASVALTAGQPVRLQVEYFETGGGSSLRLGWKLPGPSLHDQALEAARGADVAVVFATRGEGEGADLGDIGFPAEQNQLIADVAAVNPRTVVVVNSGSAMAMPWASSVKAIVAGWYPGQEYGHALAALLFGDENFSGRLPVSFPKSLDDLPARTPAQFPGRRDTVQYSEGIDVGYRWYDRRNIEPLFPFGHGLSYTRFAYGNLVVGARDAAGNVPVSFDLANTGARAGAEVAQVYVGQPAGTGASPKSLAGFCRVMLQPGESRRVTVTLEGRAFQYWNGRWAAAAGTNRILVGASARAVKLTGSVDIPPDDPSARQVDDSTQDRN